MDLNDLEHNVRDGVHIASLAGAWTALVAGFGGLRLRASSLFFAPQLPAGIDRLAFRIVFRNRRLRVEGKATKATYQLLAGDPLTVYHHWKSDPRTVDQTLCCPIPH